MVNDEQARYWNEDGGPTWVANELRQDAMLKPFDQVLLAAADPQPGEHVLDVGCGFGTTTLELARAVGEQGRVMAIDVSEAMVARVRSRVAAEAITNVIDRVGDAQVEILPAEHFHLVVSRFGVMFFEDPVAAFGNIREALRPDGRLVFVCWQPMAVNEFMAAPLAAMTDVIGPIEPPVSGVPGPFGLSDESYVRGVLSDAGYSDVTVRGFEAPVLMGAGGGVDAVVEHGSESGPARRALAPLEPDQRDAALALLRAMVAARIAENGTGDGTVTFRGAAWLVTARV